MVTSLLKASPLLGKFAVSQADGSLVNIEIKRPKKGSLKGKVIASVLERPSLSFLSPTWRPFAFVRDGGVLAIWTKQRGRSDLDVLKQAVAEIDSDPEGCGETYALATGRCYCCNLEIENPESLVRGLGPTCATGDCHCQDD